MSDDLAALAAAVGFRDRWTDYRGEEHAVPAEVLSALLTAMGFACDGKAQVAESLAEVERLRRRARAGFLTADSGGTLRLPVVATSLRLTLEDGETLDLRPVPGRGGGSTVALPDRPGYHRLEWTGGEATLALAPRAAGLDRLAPGRRLWGVAAQVYALRGGGSFGDFGDLAALAESAAAQGADAVGINPVHALFAADPGRYSPYAPSSRLFLNGLYGDPALIPGGAVPPIESSAVASSGDLIDWPAAAAEKMRQLAEAHRAFGGASEPLLEDFARFRREGGAALEAHARFEALHAAQAARGRVGGWRSWPLALRDPAGPEVAAFAAAHGAEIEFHAFLQWLADRSLAAAQARAKAAGMALGLMTDLAVGVAGDGSDAWSSNAGSGRAALLTGASIGAPPDLINDRGQNWGLTAFSPLALAAQGYAPFLAVLRSALRHAGGLRIDHILGLGRLWLMPDGATAAEGAYLAFPFEDLLRLVALESHRHRALVVGEDLGTVPEGFRPALAKAGIPGMNVLPFERDEAGRFRPPESWDPARMALTTTHDLPTLAGWWKGQDLDWAERLGFPAPERREARKGERRALWQACRAAGCAVGRAPPAARPEAAVDAAVGFVAKSAARLALVPLEDLLGLEEQPNLPGTIDEHPNWRRRLPLTTGALFAGPAAARRVALLRQRKTQ